MTRQKSFKRLVRARMAKTGESYTAARTMILAASPERETADESILVAPDETIRTRTGRGWEEWFDLIDSWGAEEMTHREIARKVAAESGADPLAWNTQAVTYSFERARGRREVGQRADGYAATASRTIGVGVDELYEAFMDQDRRSRWLPGDHLRERSGTRPKTAHFDWGTDGTRVHASFSSKGDSRSVVSIEHARLPDTRASENMRRYWRESLDRLKQQMEGGDGDA